MSKFCEEVHFSFFLDFLSKYEASHFSGPRQTTTRRRSCLRTEHACQGKSLTACHDMSRRSHTSCGRLTTMFDPPNNYCAKSKESLRLNHRPFDCAKSKESLRLNHRPFGQFSLPTFAQMETRVRRSRPSHHHFCHNTINLYFVHNIMISHTHVYRTRSCSTYCTPDRAASTQDTAKTLAAQMPLCVVPTFR